MTDGAFEERTGELPFLAACADSERMTGIPARVHDAIDDDDDLDLDPALAACVQHSLRALSPAVPAPDTEPPPLTVSALGTNLHAATTIDGRDFAADGTIELQAAMVADTIKVDIRDSGCGMREETAISLFDPFT